MHLVAPEPTGGQCFLGLHLGDPPGQPAADQVGAVRSGDLLGHRAAVAEAGRGPGGGGQRGEVRGGLHPVPGHHRDSPRRTGRRRQQH
jgi:hypothetical protein